MWPTHWPAVARDIADALDAALVAARASDAPALTEATENLAALPAEQVGAVLAGVIRELLETLHPDGLTGEDVQDVLTRCVRASALWFPAVDVDSLVTVLTGALGVAEVEENPRRPERAVEAAILVIADLLSAAEVPADGYVRRALDEIARRDRRDALIRSEFGADVLGEPGDLLLVAAVVGPLADPMTRDQSGAL